VIALGGSDDHSAGRGTGAFDSPIGSPTTMVYADELSVAGLMAGLRAGRTVVRLEGNDDPMIELSSADLPAHGDTMVADTTTLVVHVTGAELGASVRLVRDGVPGPEQDATGADLRIDFPLIAGANDAAIRAELLVGSRPRVVTSHVFLRAVTPGGPDAGPIDAGAIDAGSIDGSVDAGEVDAGPPAPRGGCGCALGGPVGSRGVGTALLALGLLIARRRRAR
jgi:MYXO-CTERM domain-containing protein